MTETATATAPRPTHTAHDTTCRCGQQLDCCARSHCPRCGRSVSAG